MEYIIGDSSDEKSVYDPPCGTDLRVTEYTGPSRRSLAVRAGYTRCRDRQRRHDIASTGCRDGHCHEEGVGIDDKCDLPFNSLLSELLLLLLVVIGSIVAYVFNTK